MKQKTRNIKVINNRFRRIMNLLIIFIALDVLTTGILIHIDPVLNEGNPFVYYLMKNFGEYTGLIITAIILFGLLFYGYYGWKKNLYLKEPRKIKKAKLLFLNLLYFVLIIRIIIVLLNFVSILILMKIINI